MIINSKLPNVANSIFSEMSALSVQENAINLAQGFPDFPLDKQLINYLSDEIKNGSHQYAPMPGLISIRETIAEKIANLYDKNISASEEITITPGATYAIFTALKCILEKNDEVIIFEPAYDSYLANIEMLGAKVIPIALDFPSYKINWQKVAEAISNKTKAIIINTPHNPTGTVLNNADINELKNLVLGKNIFIIADEVYEHIIFENKKHESVLLHDDLFEQSFVIYSFGKVVQATGWKLGYCIAPKNLTLEFRKLHQYIAFTSNTPMQAAINLYLKDPSTYLKWNDFFEQKRNLFCSLLEKTKFTIYQISSGTYFQAVGFEQISDENDIEFAKRITKECKVSAIPFSSFYKYKTDHKMIRFCFAKNDETLIEAGSRLLKI
ncbi:MAG: aminotransferase class I/II-fold pyridoxal phosphate-dependent enzyme [Chitinophagaceae bacterium]|nr:aminotransferase class I/II-fold pyridoxal phosphate-dependent enzyme [Chitinophagaceae bacterium]